MLSIFTSSAKLPILLALFGAVAACAQDGAAPSPVASLESGVGTQPSEAMALWRAPTPASVAPLGTLPGQTVASIKTHTYLNGVRQDILFARGSVHSITNGMTLIVRTSSQQTLDEAVPLFKPNEAGIRSEIGAQFPHVRMQVVERESSNAYGPYGLALGRVGDARCLYAWQYIDGNRLQSNAAVKGPVSVRVRLCETGTTFDAMAAAMDHLEIASDRSDGTTSQSAALGEGRIIIADAAAETSEAATGPHRGRVAHRRAARRLVGRHPARPEVVRVDRAPVGLSSGMSSMDEAASVPSKLSGELPAEAYRGPKPSSRPLAASAAPSY